MNPLVIAIDSSTTATKAIVVDTEGKVLALGRQDIDLLSPEQGFGEHDPRQWWTSTRDAIAEALAGPTPASYSGRDAGSPPPCTPMTRRRSDRSASRGVHENGMPPPPNRPVRPTPPRFPTDSTALATRLSQGRGRPLDTPRPLR